MLITKNTTIKWNSANKKHYEQLGYVYTGIGNLFQVKVKDLSKGSHFKVEYKCDYCGGLYDIEYRKYLYKLADSETKKDCCKKCIGHKSNEGFFNKHGYFIGKTNIQKSLATVKLRYGVDNINDIEGVWQKHVDFGKTLKGSKSPTWKGGITPKHLLLRSTFEYKEWRRQVYKRDRYVCQCCFKKNTKLNAHHILSFSDNVDERLNINNGITLCEECHINFHKIYGKGKNTKEQWNEFLANFNKG